MTIDEAEFTPSFFRNSDNIRDLFSNEEGIADIVAPIKVSSNNFKEIEMVKIFKDTNFSLNLRPWQQLKINRM